MGAIIKGAGAAFAAFCWLSAAAAQPVVEGPPSDPSVVHWDPTIRHGVLANGLHYAVMRNRTPSGAVSIRLGVNAGSLNDQPNALGEAHFLEHMAFGGSHAQLQPDVEKAFAAFGVAFGRDRNARTGLLDTVYEIDLPRAEPGALDLGFRWLRAVADGARLTPGEVDRERGVIQSEREARSSDVASAEEQILAFQAPGSLQARGPLGGSETTIQGISASELQAFYDRWYRPDNAAVIVVGDEPLDQLVDRVRQTFGGWRTQATQTAKPVSPGIDKKRGLDVLMLQEPHVPDVLSVCRIQDADPAGPQDVAAERRSVLGQAWLDIANARLAEAEHSSLLGMIEAKVYLNEVRGQTRSACFTGLPSHDGWRPSLANIEHETQQLADASPSEEELETAIKTQRSVLRGALFSKDTRVSSDLADGILTSLLEERAYPSPAEAMRAFNRAVEGITPADIREAFRRDWSGAGPLITAMAATPPDPVVVRQAWSQARPGASVSPQLAAARSPSWKYQSFGRPGRVVRREAFPETDFIRITFANGVKLNFKHTDFERNAVSVRVRFGAGRRELDPADYLLATMGAKVFEKGGLGRVSQQELGALFPEFGLHVDMDVHESGFSLSSTASPSGLSNDLQILAAYVTDPGFHDLDGLLATIWQSGLRYARTYPSIMANQAMVDAIAPGNPVSLTAAQSKPSPNAEDVARVLRPALRDAPLEITIVGDVDERAAVDAAASTFGALPARKVIPRERGDTWFLRFPDHPPSLIEGYHDGPAEKAAVALAWPLYVAEPSRRREEYALSLLALVYQDALLRRIRGDLGETYSPTVSTRMPDHADQGVLVALVETFASKLPDVRDEMEAVSAKMARGDFTDDDVETVRKPYLQRLAKRMQTNDAWANVLQSSSTDPVALNDIQHQSDIIASITAAEIRKVSARWLTPTPITVLVTKAQPPNHEKKDVAKP